MLNPAVGDTFNPTQHEAISIQEKEDVMPNSIILVVQKGFTIHDRVLRPARVIVAKKA
jgi:molecular chaperone GrpE